MSYTVDSSPSRLGNEPPNGRVHRYDSRLRVDARPLRGDDVRRVGQDSAFFRLELQNAAAEYFMTWRDSVLWFRIRPATTGRSAVKDFLGDTARDWRMRRLR